MMKAEVEVAEVEVAEVAVEVVVVVEVAEVAENFQKQVEQTRPDPWSAESL